MIILDERTLTEEFINKSKKAITREQKIIFCKSFLEKYDNHKPFKYNLSTTDILHVQFEVPDQSMVFGKINYEDDIWYYLKEEIMKKNLLVITKHKSHITMTDVITARLGVFKP